MAGPARSGSRHTILRAIFLTAAIFSAILASDIWTPASAQTTGTDSPVSVEVLPTEATFQPGDVMTFELLIENTSATPVNVSAVDVLLPSRVALAGPPPAAPGTVQPASAFTEKFDVRAGLGSDSGQVVVVAQFQSTSGDPGFAHGAVQLSPGKETAAPDISFVNTPEKLNDGQSGHALVRLSNGTPFTFETLTVVAVDAEDASVQLSGQPTSPFAACSGTKAAAHGGRPLVCLDKLEPGETDLLDVDVVAAHRVRTGTQRVGVILTGDRAVPGAASVPLSTPAATADVQLGVFGVDALTPFGIGTLFVLPGLLAVVTFLMLSRWLFPKSQKLPDTVALGDLRAMPFVAAGGALAYLIMFLVFGRNLTQRVSTGDVAELFVIGIVVGFAVWAVMAGIWQARIGRKQFSVEDSPEKVLKRLAAQNARLTLPVVAVNAMKYVFLARGRDNKPLAAPRIAYSFGNGASDQKRTEFRDALRAENPARVRELSREKVVSLGWQTAEGVIPLGADAAPSPDETLNLLLEGSDDEDGAG